MSFFYDLILLIISQMKAVAGMKMSYALQQSINSSRRTIIRGFRQDETHSALCSHLFTMIRGNRQHRRAFLISLLKLFDDSAVSKSSTFTHRMCFKTHSCGLTFFFFLSSFILSAENGGQYAAVCRGQPRLFPVPEPGGASLHHAPHRHHTVCVW